MSAERAVQIGFALFATLSTTLLSMGQQESHLPLLVGAAAVSSIVLTDVLGWVRINRATANLAAIGAAWLSTRANLRVDSESLLMAAAYLLVYLSIVLFFQRKDERIYWELAMTSLLQVVVASALNDSFLFGVLLMVYAVVALTTLSIFFTYRQRMRYGRTVRGNLPGWGNLAPDTSEEPGLAGPEFTGMVQGELTRWASGWNVARTVTAVFLGSLIFTVILFFSLPRLGRSTIQSSSISPQRVVGFSSEVELGELGSVAQNSEVVMSVEFRDAHSGLPVSIEGSPMFRGSILVEYAHGRWHRPDPLAVGHLAELRRAPGGLGTLIQTITLEPLSEPVVCCVYPVYWPRSAEGEQTGVGFDERNQQVVREERDRRRKLQIELATTGIWRHTQHPITPGPVALSPQDRARLLALDESELPTLCDQAAAVIAASGLPPEDVEGRARALEGHFLTEGLYTYSLAAPPRDRSLDPVEDFVRNHRQGHCEYFASALTLMLRSQGIPARMVVGFKGGDWNSLGQFFQIRQLHAHAWVEAYLAPNQLPPYPAGHPDQNSRRGGWLRLDPTPGSGEVGAVFDALAALGVREIFDYLKRLWHSHVVGLTSRRQQEDIYRPVARRISQFLAQVSQPTTWQSLRRRIQEFFRGNFNWAGGAAAMGICLVAVGVVQAGRFLIRRLRQWRLHRRRHLALLQTASAVEFYRKFESLARRVGWKRPPQQTAWEFASNIQERLAGRHPESASIPRQIVRDYYRVRYGEARLDKQDNDRIELSLQQLRSTLVGRNGTHGRA